MGALGHAQRAASIARERTRTQTPPPVVSPSFLVVDLKVQETRQGYATYLTLRPALQCKPPGVGHWRTGAGRQSVKH